MCCVCAVRKVIYFGRVFLDGQGDHSNYCVPRHRAAQILTQSKKRADNESNQTMFQTMFQNEHARLHSVFSICCFCPVDVLPRWWMIFRAATGELIY